MKRAEREVIPEKDEIWGEFKNGKIYMIAYKEYWGSPIPRHIRKLEDWEIVKYKLDGSFEHRTFGRLFSKTRCKI